jgi:hypothetical protein
MIGFVPLFSLLSSTPSLAAIVNPEDTIRFSYADGHMGGFPGGEPRPSRSGILKNRKIPRHPVPSS